MTKENKILYYVESKIQEQKKARDFYLTDKGQDIAGYKVYVLICENCISELADVRDYIKKLIKKNEY